MELTRTAIYRRILFTCFWIWAVFGFVQDEILPFMTSLQSIVFMTLDIVLIALGLVTIKSLFDIVMGLIFITLTAISTIFLNDLTLANYLNGFREFLPFVFMVPVLRYFMGDDRRRDDFIARFDKQLLIFLIIQAPCILYQFVKYGANDHGGGSFGNWFSGSISTIIYVITFYLVWKRWNSEYYLKSLDKNKWLLLLLLPTFFNETKISFIYFAVFFLLLYRFNIKLLFKMALAAPVFIVVYFFVYNAYMSSTQSEEESVDLNYLLFEYLSTNEVDLDDMVLFSEMLEHGDFGDDDDWSVDLPRMTKIVMVPEVLSNTHGGIVFGAGLSHFKGGTNVKPTKFAKEYHWILNGTQPYLFFVSIQLGLFGTLWIIAIMLSITGLFSKKRGNLSKVSLYSLIVFVVILFYNSAFRIPVFCLVFFYILYACNSRAITHEDNNYNKSIDDAD